MSDTEGEDNPAFTNDDECPSQSALENSNTESLQQEQRANDSTGKDQNCKTIDEPSSNDDAIREKSFVPQQSVEPLRNGVTEANSYKTETRIELPADSEAKKSVVSSPHGGVKVNGVNGNGNNNDASFLNTSTTTIQPNDGKKEQIEAVNLELVSMRPYTGNNLQTKGQEACEVPTDPYEEYFVPVNEHRKYMRGEKLYVTKDKRSRSSYWRRTACWGCGLLVLAIALIIAILAGTGVILNQEATQPLESKGRMSSQTFDEVQAAGSQEYVENPPTSPSPVESTFPPWRTTDETNLATVPEALDGVLVLDDLAWSDDLADPKSRVYRDATAEIEKHLREMLQPSINAKSHVKIYNMSENGQVMFRISYPPKRTVELTQEDLTRSLRNNGNAIGRYHVGRLNMKRLIDECQYNNLNCSDTCRFDYTRSVFACACLTGRILDDGGKHCVDEGDLSDVEMEKSTPKPSTESARDVVQGRSRAPEAAFDPRRPEDWMHEHSITVTESVDQPAAEPEPSGEPKSEPEPTAEPKSEPEPTAEPKSEPEASAEPKSEPEPTAEPKSEPEPSAEPNAEPEPSAEPKSEPEPSAEPKSESEPSAEPKSESEPSAEPKSEPEPSAEPKSEPEPTAEPKSEPEPSAEPKSEPEPSAEPNAEPEPSAEPKSEPEPSAEPKSESEPSAEPKSEPEPSAEPKSESEPSAEPKSESEPSAEPKSEPEPSAEPKSEPEPSAEPNSEPEPSAEPNSEPEPSAEPNVEPELSAEPKSEPEPSAEPESKPEPSAEPESQPDASTDPKSEPEPSAEPNAQPEPLAEPNAQPEPSAEPKSEPEPSAEPNPQPEPTAPEPSAEPEALSEPKIESELSAKSKAMLDSLPEGQAAPEPSAAPESEPAPSAVTEYSPEAKSEPEPSAEPKAEPEPPTVEPLVEPASTAEPTSEPQSFPEPKSEPQPSAEPQPSMVSELEPKPSVEPQSEPTPVSVQSDGLPEPNSKPESPVEPESKLEPSVEAESLAEPKSELSLEREASAEPKSKTEPTDELQSSSVSKSEPESSAKPESLPEVKSEPEASSMPVLEHGAESKNNSDSFAAFETIDPEEVTEKTSSHGAKPTIDSLAGVDEPVGGTESSMESDSSSTSSTDSDDHSPEEHTPKSERVMSTESTSESSSESESSVQSSTVETDSADESKSSLATSRESSEEEDSQSVTEAFTVRPATEPSAASFPKSMNANPAETASPPSSLADTSFVNEQPSVRDRSAERGASNSQFEPRFNSNTDLIEAEPETPAFTSTPLTIQPDPDESTTVSLGENGGISANSTKNDGEDHIMLIPVTTEQDNDRVTASDGPLPTLTTGGLSTNNETNESAHSQSSENSTIHPTEEKHAEDMSPFLPDIVKEKEVAKRLDKDEQDFPNPFDHHVEDAVIYHPHHRNHEETASTTNVSSISDTDEIETSDSANEVPAPDGVRSKPTAGEDEGTKDDASAMPDFHANASSDTSRGASIDDFSKVERKLVDTVGTDDQRYSPESRNTLNDAEATNDDLKLPENDLEKDTSTTETPDNREFEESKKSIPEKSATDATPLPMDPAPGVEPLLENARPDTQTAMPETQRDTTDGSLVESLTTLFTPVMTMPPSMENEEYRRTATERNVVEDQYNDIEDETIFKNSHAMINEVAHRVEVSDESSLELSTTPDRGRVTESAVTVEGTGSKSMIDSTVMTFETVTSPSDLGTVAPRDSSDARTTPGSAKFDVRADKPSEETNGTLTTENPIIPMEVLQDTATTETSMKTETTTTASSDASFRDSTSARKDLTGETPISTTIQISSPETKTTTQVPMIPDELRTTEREFSSVTSPSPMSTLADRVEKTEKEASSSSKFPIDDVSTVATATVATETYQRSWKINENTHTDSPVLPTIEEIESKKIAAATNAESVTVTPSDIKPVSEIVLDDPEPFEFHYKQLFTTTEEPATKNIVEDEETALRVISLEENEEFENTEVPATLRPIFQSETSTNEKATYQPETTVSPTAPAFGISDGEGNVIGGQSNIKIVEVTSVSDQPEMPNDQESQTRTEVIRPKEAKDPVIQGDVGPESLTPHVRQHPIVIPVYEEIEEDVQDPRMHPIVYGIESATARERIEDTFNDTRTPSPFNRDQLVNSDSSIIGRATRTNAPDEASPVRAEITALIPETTERANESSDAARKMNAPFDQSGVSSIPVGILYSKCTTGQFQCVNGTSRDGAYCVSGSAKCDSERDCSDGSDEANCEEERCLNNFQCKSGQCLARHLVCNGIKDCGDGSDESECNEWSCNFDEFRCPSGRCIPDLWRCDGRPDCEDHRDEYSCSESCGNDEYLCQTEKWCIPQTWRCNGVSECASGEDEKLCDCSLEQFKCRTGGCIAGEQVCDGIEHCPDRSDEWNCLNDNLTIATNGSATEDGENGGAVAQATLLKIRQSNNERRLVCNDDWSNELSDAYCRNLGFSGAESTQAIVHEGGQKVLKLRSNADAETSLVSKLESADMCESGKVVEVSCREFTCGAHETEGPTARLVGGTAAGEGQWSSVALLREVKHGVACTASVLGPMHALASYSCIHRLRQSTSWELFTGRDLQKSTAVKTIIPYPQVKYNQFLYSNDIALVELAEPLVFSRNVSAVCLPSRPFQPRALCVTAGWGFATNGEVNLKQYLKFLPVPTYDSEQCNATSHYAGFITKDNICAGFTDADKGSCYNDEGAPLMCATENGRWEIQGLLSHHSRCSRVHPAIYSSLNPALSWLRNSVPALQIQT